MQVSDGTIEDVRVAAGGVGTKPWHLPEVEAVVRGTRSTPGNLRAAAEQAVQGAQLAAENGFKLVLLRRTMLRATRRSSRCQACACCAGAEHDR